MTTTQTCVLGVPIGLLAIVGAVSAPASALLAVLALGLAVGGVVWAWVDLTTDSAANATRAAAVNTGALAVGGGLALIGVAAVAGSALPVVIAAMCGCVAMATVPHGLVRR